LQQRGLSAALLSFLRPRSRPTEGRRSLSTGAVTGVSPVPRKQQVQNRKPPSGGFLRTELFTL